MKTSININLFGTVYAIDEDAHKLLDQYLTNLKSYFAKQEGGDEIADDIEHRIAELFWELKQQGTESICIEQVTQILHKIGNPEEMGNEEPNDTKQEGQKSSEDQSTGASAHEAPRTENNNRQGQRRYYRDGQNKRLGGVLSGICHYFGWSDPLILRICFVFLCLFTDGIFLFIYLLLWLIAPKAVTAEQRLQMKGQAVNPESIRSEVLNGADTNNVNPEQNHSGCLKVLLGMLLAPVGCVGLFVLFVAGIVLFSLLMGLTGGLMGVATSGSALLTVLLGEWSKILVLVICALAIIGLPLYGLWRWFRRDSRPMDTYTPIILVGLWLLATLVGWTYANNLKHKFAAIDWSSVVEDLDHATWDNDDEDDDNEVASSYDAVLTDAFRAISFAGVGKVEFIQADSCQVEIAGNEWLKKHTIISTQDSTLTIELDDQAKNGNINKGLNIKVQAPYLTTAHVTGVGTFRIVGELNQSQPIELKMEGVGKLLSGKITSPRIAASQEGVGKTDIEVDTDSLLVNIEGVGKMEVKGRAASYQRNANEMLCKVNDEHLHIGN